MEGIRTAMHRRTPRLCRRLTRLELDVLAVVPHTLALVWLGLANRANFGSELTDQLLVATLDHNVRLIWASDLQPFGDLLLHFVRISDTQGKHVPFDRTEISDSLDLQFFLVTLDDTVHHVLDQRTRQAVERSHVPFV